MSGRSHKKRWTERDVAFLRANYGVLATSQIAEALGRGFPAVTAKITLLGLARIHEWTPEQDAFIRKHADKGWAWCAKELGRSIVSVYNRVRRLGIQLKMLGDGDLKTVRELHSQGMTTFEIGEQIGVSGECIRFWERRLKLPSNPRNERKRMDTQRRNLKAKYSVETVAMARKVRRRRTREASLRLGLSDMAKRIVATK
jgi:hypothetical protein